jgi:hypothetical protein
MGTYTYVGPPTLRPVSAPDRKPATAPGTPARAAPREQLTDSAARLLKALPFDAGMPCTARDFPHVLNRIAEVWSDVRAFSKLMNGLLIDDRPDREGFPAAVILELDALQQHRLRLLRRNGG